MVSALIQKPDRRSTTYGKNGLGNNLGTNPTEKGVKRGIRADQKAKRVNNLTFFGPACKTSISGSNPDGASNFFRSQNCSHSLEVSPRVLQKNTRFPAR